MNVTYECGAVEQEAQPATPDGPAVMADKRCRIALPPGGTTRRCAQHDLPYVQADEYDGEMHTDEAAQAYRAAVEEAYQEEVRNRTSR